MRNKPELFLLNNRYYIGITVILLNKEIDLSPTGSIAAIRCRNLEVTTETELNGVCSTRRI